MKKINLLLWAYLFSIPVHASIEEGRIAFEDGKLKLAQNILSQESNTNYQKHLYLALIASKEGKLDDAEDFIDRAIKLNPKNADLQYVYAEIMGKQAEDASIFSVLGYIKKIKKAFTTAVELAPKNIKYRRGLIQFHIHAPGMIGGDIELALKHALDLKGLDALAGSIALLQVYQQMENQAKFDNELKTAMLDFVDEPELYYQLGIYYQQQERYGDAFTYLRKASSLATATDEQRNAKYNAIFQVGRTSILSESNLDEGKKALTQYFNEAVITSSMPTKDWAKFRLANITEIQGRNEKAIALYKDLIQESSDIDLQKQLKKRIKNLK
jgi:tetratricopeptide (TPR) repeat protein